MTLSDKTFEYPCAGVLVEDIKEFAKEFLEGDINKIPINSREKQIIALVKEDFIKVFGKELTI